jgi:hypothetical protein
VLIGHIATLLRRLRLLNARATPWGALSNEDIDRMGD